MTEPTATPATLVHIDPTTLPDHPSNVRDDLGDLNELTASIHQVGVLEPLVVVPTDDGHRILTGHRRKAAAIAAGLTTVPCYERPDLADDRDQVLAILIENLRRDDLTELEPGGIAFDATFGRLGDPLPAGFRCSVGGLGRRSRGWMSRGSTTAVAVDATMLG